VELARKYRLKQTKPVKLKRGQVQQINCENLLKDHVPYSLRNPK
jgi:hypothetical protein